MAHNFRLTGNYYVSKAGSDNNAGSPDAPFFTVGRALKTPQPTSVIVGTGSYAIGPQLNSFDYTPKIYGDGTVKIIGDGATKFWAFAGEQGSSYTNLYFDKFGGFAFNGVNFYGGANYYNHCIFKVVSENASALNSQARNSQFTNCIFVNLNFGSGELTFVNCLFFNCTITAAASVTKCYLDPTTSIVTAAATTCNVDPRCQTANGYGLNLNGVGFAYTSPGGISALPAFNSLAREDFSLQKSSPHIALGIGPEQYRYSNTCFLEFTGTPGDACTTANTQLRFTGSGAIVRLKSITASPDALTFNNQGGLVRIPNSNGNGYSQFVTQRIPFSDIAQQVTVINILAGLNIDTDAVALENQQSLAAPSPFNNNAPDYNNWSSGSAGRNPNRLTFRARWSTNIDPDVDNPDQWVSGPVWIEFEWGSAPQWIQSQLLGNGNPAFNPSDSAVANIVARFLQLEVTIRDNYFSK